MLPVVTPEEMAAIDAAAPEPVEELIRRAGRATARAAREVMGGTYGRRVVVVAGKGNNGRDGWDAADRLDRRGAHVVVVAAADATGMHLPAADLVIDAAYGTGFRGEYHAPDTGSAPVLAVDIPSGVDGLTGVPSGRPATAVRTVTFAALKPGLLFYPGRKLAGEVTLADIGLDVSSAQAGVVEAADVASWVPPRDVATHKWKAALLVVAGSPGMTGAAHLAAAAAQRAGAGMVRLASPGLADDPMRPTEAVGVPGVDRPNWDLAVAEQLDRAGAVLVGPGLGLADATVAAVRRLVAAAAGHPLLIDGDGLTGLGDVAAELLQRRATPAVLTPHDGEYARLAGRRPGDDRIAAARTLASNTESVVLLKGPTTVAAHPDGRVRLSTAGDQRLATAGTGDVLSGTIGALLARGLDPFDAAAAGAWLHGTAAAAGPAEGLVASDVVEALPLAFAQARAGGGEPPSRPGVTHLAGGTTGPGGGESPHRSDGPAGATTDG